MLSLRSASDFIPIPTESDGLSTVLAADAGDRIAQNDAGLMFAEMENQKAALYWWKAAASQGDADAMHHLGKCYIDGQGVGTDQNLGIMWIAKAAAAGHIIASLQIQALRPTSKWHSIKLP
jgi:TPR repeat protein